MWWGSTGHLRLRVIITLLLLYWLSNSQLTVCPLDPKGRREGEEAMSSMCVGVCWWVLTPCVAQRSQILKQGLRAEGVAEISSSSLHFTPGWDGFLFQNNKIPSFFLYFFFFFADKAATLLDKSPLKQTKKKSYKANMMFVCTHMLLLSNTHTHVRSLSEQMLLQHLIIKECTNSWR